MTCFNAGSYIVDGDHHEFTIGARMLHSHFCREASLIGFFTWLNNYKWEEVGPRRAFRLLR